MTIDKQEIKVLALACDPAKCADEAEEGRRHAEFYSELTPETVLALLAEIEMLTAQRLMHLRLNMSLRARRKVWVAACEKAEDELLDALAERDQLKAENEALRKQVADLSPFKSYVPQDCRASNKCLACGEYHHGLAGLPCPKMTPVAQAFAGVNQRVVPVEPLRIPHPLEAMAKEVSHDR